MGRDDLGAPLFRMPHRQARQCDKAEQWSTNFTRERQRAGETAVQAQAIRADLVQPAAAAVRAERDEEERSSLSSPALKNA